MSAWVIELDLIPVKGEMALVVVWVVRNIFVFQCGALTLLCYLCRVENDLFVASGPKLTEVVRRCEVKAQSITLQVCLL